MPALELDAIEARLLGVLIEKERTTPEQYPLSRNALVSGANQKSNRAPVMELSDADVNGGIERLRRKSLVGAAHSSGARVERYRHAAAAVLELDPAELAVMAELMLRGAQMPGELRSRAERMSPIPDLAMLGNLLENLRQKGFVRRLEPLPGARAPQWEQIVAASEASQPTPHPSGVPARTPLAEGAMPVARVEPPRVEPSRVEPSFAARPLPANGIEDRVAALEAEVARLARLYEDLARR
jgi:uncharacterized protein YceH (UPF0502 family)